MLELLKGFCACLSNVTAENASMRLEDSPQTGSDDCEQRARDPARKNDDEGVNISVNEGLLNQQLCISSIISSNITAH